MPPGLVDTALLGFVSHPVLFVSLVLVQFGWSHFVFDPASSASFLSLAMIAACASCIVGALGIQCQRRAACLFVPQWSIAGGAIFQGQLVLGMPVISQMLCGASMGILVSAIDETEALAYLLSFGDVERLRSQASGGARAHASQEHLGLYVAFLVHGWLWTVFGAYLLGEWSNAATIHSTQPDLHFD